MFKEAGLVRLGRSLVFRQRKTGYLHSPSRSTSSTPVLYCNKTPSKSGLRRNSRRSFWRGRRTCAAKLKSLRCCNRLRQRLAGLDPTGRNFSALEQSAVCQQNGSFDGTTRWCWSSTNPRQMKHTSCSKRWTRGDFNYVGREIVH